MKKLFIVIWTLLFLLMAVPGQAWNNGWLTQLDWKTVTASVTAKSSENLLVDTSASAVTVTLPAAPHEGDMIRVLDIASNFATENCILGRNGLKIRGAESDVTLSTDDVYVCLVYYDATNGWQYSTGGGGGSGDMTKAVYDTNDDSAIDADKVATLNQDTTGSSGSVKSPATTGVTQFTGPAAGETRVKTVRDANDTILEQGGSYTPTGTWAWTSATVTWPTALALGTDDTTAGAFTIYGDNADAGGKLFFYNSANEDATEEHWVMEAQGTNFWFGSASDPDQFIFSNEGDFTITGKISAGFKSLTPVTGAAADFASAFTGVNLYGGTFLCDTAGTIQLPAVGVGMNFTIITVAAIAIVVEPCADPADKMLLDGTLLDDQDSATNLSTAGDIIVFQYMSSDGWVATSNGWTDED